MFSKSNLSPGLSSARSTHEKTSASRGAALLRSLPETIAFSTAIGMPIRTTPRKEVLPKSEIFDILKRSA